MPDLYIDESFESGALNPKWMYITNDVKDVSITGIAAREGDHCAYFAITDEWPQVANDPACEVRIVGVNTYNGHPTPSGQVERGDDVWLGFSVMFPDGNVSGGDIIFAQFHSGKSEDGTWGNPHLSLRIDEDNRLRMRTRHTFVDDDPKPRAVDYDTGVIARPELWYDFVLHVKWSYLDDGFIHAWLDGVPFVVYTGRTVGSIAANKSTNLKLGMYMPHLRQHTPVGWMQQTCIDAVRYGPANAGYDAVVPRDDTVGDERVEWMREGEAISLLLDAWMKRGQDFLLDT